MNFISSFPDEATCRSHLREQREQAGIVCNRCGHTEHHWWPSHQKWQCKRCGSRKSLRSGTVMESSNLPVREWYIAMHLLTSTKKSFSALELQRQLGRKRYEPVWYMLHKLRAAMGKRDNRYELKEFVELDEGFFERVRQKNDQTMEEPPKRGRGSQKQSKVLVMVESKPSAKPPKNNRKKPARSCGHVKMIVVEDLSWETVKPVVENSIDKKATVRTDDSTTYSKLKESVSSHQAIKTPPKQASTVLPWVHTVIANTKRTLLGIHHMIGEHYMQNYLNEIAWKMNRRYFGEKMFDRLMVTAITDVWYVKPDTNCPDYG